MPATPDSASDLLVRVAWHGDGPRDPGPPSLAAALALADRNDVAAILIRTYAERLPAERAQLDGAVAAYRRNLAEACRRLVASGVQPILIKALPTDEYTYSNFDVVVGDDGWRPAMAALRSWAVSTGQHPLERATKLLLYPADGPALHLHREVAWFDVPILPTADLRRRARPATGVACLLPCSVDALRILVAHATFQNLAFSLGELRTYRTLATPGVEREAWRLARDEGWGRAFEATARTARRAIARLDARQPTALPVPLPVAVALLGGAEHALGLARRGRAVAAARELALRGPLVVAKRRAALRAVATGVSPAPRL